MGGWSQDRRFRTLGQLGHASPFVPPPSPQSLPSSPLPRCRQFPSLINCCTIDWYSQWPEEALISVSRKFLAGTDLGGDEVRREIGAEGREQKGGAGAAAIIDWIMYPVTPYTHPYPTHLAGARGHRQHVRAHPH